MKKRILIYLVISIICFSANVFAIPEYGATVKVGNVEVPVYNVETSWGMMQFTYNEQINYEWDVENHVYELADSTYKWVATDNYIDVNNKSHKGIEVELSYNNIDNQVLGQFNESKRTIDTNEKVRFTLTLDGKLTNNSTEYVKVGLINFTIK